VADTFLDAPDRDLHREGAGRIVAQGLCPRPRDADVDRRRPTTSLTAGRFDAEGHVARREIAPLIETIAPEVNRWNSPDRSLWSQGPGRESARRSRSRSPARAPTSLSTT